MSNRSRRYLAAILIQAALGIGTIEMATSQPVIPPSLQTTESHRPCFRSNTSSAGAPAETIATHIRGVPAVVRSPSRIERPPIILWHGFGPPADPDAMVAALPLDGIAAEKIYLELPFFGERGLPGGTAELIARQNRDYLTQVLAPVVAGARADLAAVIMELRERGCLARSARVTVIGFSAGGLAALSATASTTTGSDIQAAIVLNAPTNAETAVRLFENASGRPYTWSADSKIVARSLNVAAGLSQQRSAGSALPSLLLLQGEDDATPLVGGVIAFESAVRSLYPREGDASDFKVLKLAHMGHAWASGEQRTIIETLVTQWIQGH